MIVLETPHTIVIETIQTIGTDNKKTTITKLFKEQIIL